MSTEVSLMNALLEAAAYERKERAYFRTSALKAQRSFRDASERGAASIDHQAFVGFLGVVGGLCSVAAGTIGFFPLAADVIKSTRGILNGAGSTAGAVDSVVQKFLGANQNRSQTDAQIAQSLYEEAKHCRDEHHDTRRSVEDAALKLSESLLAATRAIFKA